MGLFGGLLGQGFGAMAGGMIGGKTGANIGQQIGGGAGSALIPFHTGGLVKKGRTRAIMLPGEYVLPRGVKPTATQRKAVAARKAAKRGGKGGRGKK